MKLSDIISIIIQTGILSGVLGLVVSLVKLAKVYLDIKTAEATSNIKNANVRNALDYAEECVTTAVLEMSQTIVDDLKAKSADGKLTPDGVKQVKADTVAKVQTMLSDDTNQTLNTVFGDANTWISSKIEATIKKSKTVTTSTNTMVAALTSQPITIVPDSVQPDTSVQLGAAEAAATDATITDASQNASAQCVATPSVAVATVA